MEIISRGKRAASRKVELSCYRCGTVIRCTIGEMKYSSDQRDGSYYDIACPECKGSIPLAASVAHEGGYYGPG